MMALPVSPPAIADLASALTEHLLTQKSIHRVRGITAVANCTSVVLSGTCISYYSKQQAQEIARAFLAGRASIRNIITVREESDSTSPTED